MDNLKLVENLGKARGLLRKEIGRIIIGQEDIVEMLFMAMLCSGHVLLEGVPGLAKTLIIKTLANALDLSFSRIQFTPDLMPSDITGTEIIQETSAGGREFKFFKGPVFANIILADEINRTPPKTQSALLEAMQEHSVTAAGTTYGLEEPFFVMATQNPIEQEGTYPLPEAQLDRFMFNLRITYPPREDEVKIVNATTGSAAGDTKTVLSQKDVIAFQDLVHQVPVAENVVQYAVDLVRNSRPGPDNKLDFIREWVQWGAGPRASQYLILGGKVRAVLDGRPTPDFADITAMIKPVMRHRIIPNFNAEAEGVDTDKILERLVQLKY
ncbi:MAG: MoxR family ATPase [Candidatus Marinimicrobia bacterium]|nr:MoxR family ATPase [Candidatus Neomarinimicrobiota bacterium]